MENEKRLIWDEDAKRHLIALATGHRTETLHIDMILNAILHHTPTVDAVEVVRGRWIRYRCLLIDEYICSECKEFYPYAYNYCPNCGAKMDGGNDDEIHVR